MSINTLYKNKIQIKILIKNNFKLINKIIMNKMLRVRYKIHIKKLKVNNIQNNKIMIKQMKINFRPHHILKCIK